MKIILLQSVSGPAGTWNAGDEYTCVDAAEAKRMIDAGFAKPAKTGRSASKTETATKKETAVERAVK